MSASPAMHHRGKVPFPCGWRQKLFVPKRVVLIFQCKLSYSHSVLSVYIALHYYSSHIAIKTKKLVSWYPVLGTVLASLFASNGKFISRP